MKNYQFFFFDDPQSISETGEVIFFRNEAVDCSPLFMSGIATILATPSNELEEKRRSRLYKRNGVTELTELFKGIGLRGRGFTLEEVLAEICKRDDADLGLEFFPDGDPESAYIVHIGENGDHIHFWRDDARACAWIGEVDYHDVSWLEALKLLIDLVDIIVSQEYWSDRERAEMGYGE